MKRQTLPVTALPRRHASRPGGGLATEDHRFETEAPNRRLRPGKRPNSQSSSNDANDIDEVVETATDVEATMKQNDNPFALLSKTYQAPFPMAEPDPADPWPDLIGGDIAVNLMAIGAFHYRSY